MRRLPILAACLLAFVPTARAQSGAVTYAVDSLANGLKLIVHEDHSTPIVAVNVLYHVGSANEVTGRTGFAHLFEHLMFEGSMNVPGNEFDGYTNRAGGTNNAYTANDKTNYYEIFPANWLDVALWMESDRMANLAFSDENLENQRQVVKEERRFRVDNQPYGTVEEQLYRRIYPAGHPYSWPVIGSMADLDAATMDDFKSFFHKYYAPNNATLVVAGDITMAEVKPMVERYFADIARGPAIVRPTIAPVRLAAEQRATVEDDVQLPGVFMGYPVTAEGAADTYALQLASDILSDGESSRLYDALVYRGQLVQSVNTSVDDLEGAGMFTVSAVANAGKTVAQIEAALNKELVRLASAGVTEAELQKAKYSREAGFIASRATVQGKANNLAHYATMRGDIRLINSEIDRYMSVTAADIQRVVRQYLVPSNRVVLGYVPRKAAAPAGR